MSKINILPGEIFNRIAAGEVVDRPASIVKELVENSIDADASIITIDIKHGGISYIKVSDNGCGIESEYIKTAFLPHATSKVLNLEDLDSITTLGFRGEALPSIASVSKVKLVTRTKNDETASMLEVSDEGFTVSKKGAPLGTYITVEDLFYNVPARAKFLKKPSLEETEITNLVQRLILANPDISIKYSSDGKNILKSDGQGVENALYSVYGKESLEKTLPLYSVMSDIVLSGYIGKEEYSKSNRTYQTLIINGRYVRNKVISDAVAEAYSDRLMTRQYPFFVLYLTMPYNLIDVNVHPNKLDVKFWNDSLIYDFVYDSVVELLNRGYTVPEAALINRNDSKSDGVSDIETDSMQVSLTSRIGKVLKTGKGFALKDSASMPSQDLFQRERNVDYSLYNSNKDIHTDCNKDADVSHSITAKKEDDATTDKDSLIVEGLKDMRLRIDTADNRRTEILRDTFTQSKIESEITDSVLILGVAFQTYIIIQYGEDLYFIDQHAAHERLLYDKLNERMQKNNVEKQSLLLPYVFEVNVIENQFIKDNLNLLRENGFDTEEFGINCFKITSVPLILNDINLKEFIGYFLKDMTNLKKNINVKNFVSSRLMQEACKAAIKGGDAVPKEELNELVKRIIKSGCTLMCPHGRPLAVKFTKSNLEKWFKRIVN